MANLSTHQLNVFLVAAETLNFTKAAKLLNVTQPSVSQHIHALEQHFETDLFVRSGRTIELSDSGAVLIPLAREMVYLGDHLEEKMAKLHGNVFGHLIIGCSTSAGRYLLPGLLTEFHKIYPQVNATCHVISEKKAQNMLIEGKVHVSLISDPDVHSKLEFIKYIQEKIVLVSHPKHRFASMESVKLNDIFSEDLIMPDEGTEICIELWKVFARKKISFYDLNPVMILGSPEAICLSIQEGLGIGFVPELVVDKLSNDKVAKIKIEDLDIVRDIYAARNISRPQIGTTSAFWEFIQSKIKSKEE